MGMILQTGEYTGEAPDVLLPYQAAWIADQSAVKVAEKGRRIGLTWAEASDDVLIAATEGRDGDDVMYIGYNQEMTREFIDTCAWWAKALDKAAQQVEEFMFADEDKDILTFRIRFDSGHEIVALSSRPTNLRGRQGVVVLDEAAFHDSLKEVLKAALAFLMWGGKVRVISTHDGEENPFNQMVEDVRGGKLPYSLHRITFDDALEAGLYKRICLMRGLEWTPEAQAKWRKDIVDFYGDGAAEELFCVPSRGGGAYLVRTVIEACMSSVPPVLRWSPPAADFVDWDDAQRFREVDAWCRGELAPALDGLAELPHWFGEDFGRDVDLTVIWPIQELPALCWYTPLVVELRDCPFQQQEQILYYLVDRLPRFSGGALDAGGNGSFLAERARQRYGADSIEQIKFHEAWNLEHWPPFKAALEDRTITIPKDSDILDDLRAVRKVKGVPKVPRDARTEAKDKGKRHGDAAVAAALALFAARTINANTGPAEYETVSRSRFRHRSAY